MNKSLNKSSDDEEVKDQPKVTVHFRYQHALILLARAMEHLRLTVPALAAEIETLLDEEKEK